MARSHSELHQKHIQEDIITDKGHIHLIRQIKNKTKNQIVTEEALEPQQETNNKKLQEYYVRIETTGLIKQVSSQSEQDKGTIASMFYAIMMTMEFWLNQ